MPPSVNAAAQARVDRVLEVRRLGVVDYRAAVDLQDRLVEDRRADRVPDQLLLLQHPPVITLGVSARTGSPHVLASPERLAREGISLHEAGRGGDVTYHGPGQIVGYPIVNLRPDRCDVHRYVRDLEEVLIRTAASFGVQAGRVAGLTGVWVGNGKLAAIGVRISRWITSHGFAFNVEPDLSHFGFIVPCGIRDRGVTSLAALLGRTPAMADVEDRLVEHFRDVFDARTAGPDRARQQL
jgi:lipoyl(octanoyl) transferase